jgi:hypothetical protein
MILSRHTSEGHPAQLEHVADDWQIAASEDEEEGGTKSDTRGTRVLPAEQGVEE